MITIISPIIRQKKGTYEQFIKDANKDGYLQPAESQKLLKARYKRIKDIQDPRVNNAIEAFYDKNNDGKLSNAEKNAMKGDII